MERIFKPPFSMTGAISHDRQRCQFLFCLTKIPPFYRSARAESGREGREGFLRARLVRNQNERRRRLACAGGLRLSECLGDSWQAQRRTWFEQQRRKAGKEKRELLTSSSA